MSPRLWFRLQKLKASWLAAFGGKEQSYDSAHRMCPNCRALIERGASQCPLCGAPTKAPRSRPSSTPGRVLGVIPVPSTATSALVAANLALYAISWYLTQNLASAELNAAPAMGGIYNSVLWKLGENYGPAVFGGEWWRLITAMFLHAGLFHIGMNLWCLFDLGPTVESLFCITKFVVLYLVTGVAGFLVSALGPVPSVGASGAILGLIGILIGASFHHGRLGRDIRSQLWRWVIYILILAFVPFVGADTRAHIGGLISGLVLGYLVPEGEPTTRASENLWNTLALLSVLAIAGSFALMALQLNRPVR